MLATSQNLDFNIHLFVVDNEPPLIQNCPPSPLNTVIDLDQVVAQVFWPLVLATDNSGIEPVVSRSHSSGSSFPEGATTVTIEFTDSALNTAQCIFVVNVIQSDPVPPLITGCPADIERSISLEATDTPVSWMPPRATDNDGEIPDLISNFSPGARFSPGVWNVIYTFTDTAGNTQQCQFSITISRVDDVPPIVTCPASIQQIVIEGSAGTYVTWDPPVVSDNSGTVEFVSSTASSGDLFAVGLSSVTYTYSDPSGNQASCSFTVTVITGSPCNPNPCQNGGLCVPTDLTSYQCICTECFTGTNCETNLNACVNNFCENGAICIPDPGSCTDYSCQCTDCFTGRFCNLPLDSCENHQCQNGGGCTVDPLNCVLYTCTCPLCFTGQFCEQEVSACTFNLCANGANCIPVGTICTEYKCSCPGCYTGAYCNELRDPCFNNPCMNGGICSALNDGNCFSYTCECFGCNTGYNCEITIPSPCSGNPCQNGGNCLSIQGQCAAYQCQCPPNFGGLHCENVVTTNPNPCNSFPCLNGAECLTMDSTFYTCLCRSGFAGIDCQQPTVPGSQATDLCLTNPCQNGATCVASYHSSNRNFYQPQYYCICNNGFTGTNCQQQTAFSPNEDICNVVRPERPDCQGGAPCYNSYQSFTSDVDYYCDCPIGLTGHNCETIAPNPCDSNPCQNGGNCLPFKLYYTCSCPQGFLGDRCQTSTDTTVPAILNCPADIEVQVAFGQTMAFATWQEPTSPDGNRVFRSDSPSTLFPLGTTSVSYVFEDVSENRASCTFFVIVSGNVVDDTPQQSLVALETSLPPYHSALRPQRPFGSFPVLPTTTVLPHSRATTALGMSSQRGSPKWCMLPPTLQDFDETPPVIDNCPEERFATLPDGSSTVPVVWPAPQASDNSGQVTLSSNYNPGASFPPGQTLVFYAAKDPYGLLTSCTFTVFVSTTGDTNPPVISGCPESQFVTAPPGSSSVPVTWIPPTATDDTGIVTITGDSTPGSSFPVGTTSVRYEARDSSGLVSRCTFQIFVTADGGMTGLNCIVLPNTVDRVPPQVTCPPDEVYNVEVPLSGRTVTFGTATATDLSTVSLVSVTPQTGTFFSTGSTTVTYTYRDASNNEASCTFLVIVNPVDNTPPVIQNCPPQLSEEIGFGATSGVVSWPIVFASDNSGQVEVLRRSHNNGDIFPLGTAAVTIEFSDPSGNTALCSFTVTVTAQVDNIPPVVNCPPDVTQTVELGTSSRQVFFDTPTVSDNSGSFSLVQASHQSGNSFTTGATIVTYTYTDGSGNTASCSFRITINAVDRVPPQVTCPPDEVYNVEVPLSGRTVNFGTATATDLSTVSLVSVTPQTGTFFSTGSTTVTYTYRDASNNQASCTFSVIINSVDTTNPQIVCPEGFTESSTVGTGGTVVTWIPATATDNSGSVTVTSDRVSPMFFNFGETIITYTARDPSGNIAICSFTIVLIEVDNEPPLIQNCPPSPLNTVIDLDQPDAQVFWPLVLATDNSGIEPVVSRSHSSGSSFPEGATTVTIEFTDSALNTAQCIFVVNVIQSDPVPPLITGCPADIERSISLEATDTPVSWMPPRATDNDGEIPDLISNFSPGARFSPGVWNVIYTFTDRAGNLQQCQFSITISRVDDVPPIVTCPASIQQIVIEGSAGTYVTWDPPVVSDNSGTVEFVSSTASSGDLFAVGLSSVTYTYSDPSGNQASCSFTVTVITGSPCNPNPCQNGGLCVPTDLTSYQCICTECFTGTNCETNLNACVNNLCENGAICIPDPGSCTDYSCQCTDCFTGRFCNLPLDSCENHQCQNGGGCTVDPLNCVLYTCTCPLCFTGQFCEQEVSACTFNLCANGANCIPVGTICTEYKCSCPGCYTGAYCNELRDPCFNNPCMNGGICSALNDGNCFSYTCECFGCNTGYNCEITIPSPCSGNPCQNGGNCLSIQGQCAAYQCQCPPNFGGLHCENGKYFQCVNGKDHIWL
nr:hyalin-like [Lytechinus pictus]